MRENTRIDWSVWPKWAVLNAIGWPAGAAAALFSASLGGSGLTILLALTVFTGTIGLAQWLVLKRHIARAGWWIAASVAGVALSAAASVFARSEGILIVWLLLGFSVGLAQWIVLQQHVRWAGVWFLVTAIGWTPSFGWLTTGQGLAPSLSTAIGLNVAFIVSGIVAGFAYGIATGPVLAWLLHNSLDTPAMPRTLRQRVASLGFKAAQIAAVFLITTWVYVAGQLLFARSHGVYPTPEDGARARIASAYVDIERIAIRHAGPYASDGSTPHVWYVAAEVWAARRSDGIAMSPRGYDRHQSIFVEVHDSWVSMPEGAAPELIGVLMKMFGLS